MPYLIGRVALLTTGNTHTISCTGLQALLHHPSRTYGTQHALSQLFANITSQNLRINTNEPVLLINNLGGLDGVMLQEIADAAANLLRCEYHIRPVRVYAGNFTPIAVEEKDVGFSISLLNVVNTDIGGPGMVQLLDMVDWEGKGAVRREAWDGSGQNLVRREDYEVAKLGDGDVKAEDVSEAGGSEKGEWESEPEVEREADDVFVEDDGKEQTKALSEGDGVEAEPDIVQKHREIGNAIPDAFEAPKEAEGVPNIPIEEPESRPAQLREIKHPSWEREHDNESLLDMIAKQSKRLSISKAGNAYATSAAQEKADLSGEDEYELV